MERNIRVRTSIRILAAAAMLIALDILSARFLFFYTPLNVDRISTQFIANATAGMLFGPWLGALTAALGDIVGMFLNPGGMVFTPLITLACVARGMIYGLLLYRRPASLVRCVVAVAVVTLVIELLYMPMVLSSLYRLDYLTTLLAKIPWRLGTIPVYGSILFAVFKGLSRAGIVRAYRGITP